MKHTKSTNRVSMNGKGRTLTVRYPKLSKITRNTGKGGGGQLTR